MRTSLFMLSLSLLVWVLLIGLCVENVGVFALAGGFVGVLVGWLSS